jgi:hypothetical protein
MEIGAKGVYSLGARFGSRAGPEIGREGKSRNEFGSSGRRSVTVPSRD